jgi:GTP-binding protein HflX
VRAVDETLAGLTSRKADVLVLNKIDRVPEPLAVQALARGRAEEVVFVSAHSGEGLEELERVVQKRLDVRSPVVEVHVSAGDGKSIAALKAAGTVLAQGVDGEELVLRLRLLDGALGALQSALGPRARFEVLQAAAEPFLKGG